MDLDEVEPVGDGDGLKPGVVLCGSLVALSWLLFSSGFDACKTIKKETLILEHWIGILFCPFNFPPIICFNLIKDLILKYCPKS